MIHPRSWLAGALVVLCAALASGLAQAARHRKHHAPAAEAKPAAPAPSATESLGSSGSWTAYAMGPKGARVCYLVGKAQKTEPGNFPRKPPMAMVTHRPAEKIANVVSFVEGYMLKPDSRVAVAIDDHNFEMFTKDDSAWARTSELDRTIVRAFEKGKRAVVKGTPAKGPPTTDTYSLIGFTKALGLIDKACGIKREGSNPSPVHAAVHHHRHGTSKHRHR